MQPRRPLGHGLALIAAALLLCVPVLSSCGFNKATDRPYTQADGINYRKGTVYVLNAVIAAAQSGSGTLIASFSNQSESTSATLESVAGGSGNTVTAADFAPVTIDPTGYVNLADDDTTRITLTGNFAVGDVIPVSMTFENGSVIEMDVPVVYACGYYAGLDASTSAPTAVSPIAPADSTTSPTDATTPPGEATPTPSDTSQAAATPSPTAYTCGTTGGTGGQN